MLLCMDGMNYNGVKITLGLILIAKQQSEDLTLVISVLTARLLLMHLERRGTPVRFGAKMLQLGQHLQHLTLLMAADNYVGKRNKMV